MRRIGLVAVLLALVATPAWAGSDPAAADATRVKGKVVFPVTDARTACSFQPQGTKLKEHCVPAFGSFAGIPGAAGASVGWTWLLQTENGKSTGKGTETGILKLNFGGRTLELALTGRVKPFGTQPAGGGRTKTTGTCKVKKKTGFARTVAGTVGPTCTYTFDATYKGTVYTKLVFTIDVQVV